MAHLFYEKDGQEQKVELPRDTFLIGRMSSCHLSIEDTELSRQHCQIEFEDGSYYVRDLHSQNGTRVNGQPIARHRLAPGDVVSLGHTRLSFDDPAGTHRAPLDVPTSTLVSRKSDGESGSGTGFAGETATPEQPEFLFCGTAGERAGEEYLVGPDGLTIGRRITSTIVLNETSVSMDHATLRLEGGKVRIHDCESRNGVLVSGIPIAGDHTLSEGDTVQIGAAKFQLRRRARPKIPGSDALRRFLLSLGGEPRTGKPGAAPGPAAASAPEAPAAGLEGDGRPEAAGKPRPAEGSPDRRAANEGQQGVSGPDAASEKATAKPGPARKPKAGPEPGRATRAAAAPSGRRAQVNLLVRVMSIVGPLSIIVASAWVAYNHPLGNEGGTSPAVERGRDLAVLGLYMEAHRCVSKATELWRQDPAPDEKQLREALALAETAIARYMKALEMQLPEKSFREIERELVEALRLREQVAAALGQRK